MPLFISEQAERDYYTLRRTMDLAQFKNDRPLIDWCERFLALFNGSIHEARYVHSETAFRLLKDPDSPIPPWKITAYAFLDILP